MNRTLTIALPRAGQTGRSVSPLRMVALWRQRRALARLSPEALTDMGLSADAAHAEATRPMWDVPVHWRG